MNEQSKGDWQVPGSGAIFRKWRTRDHHAESDDRPIADSPSRGERVTWRQSATIARTVAVSTGLSIALGVAPEAAKSQGPPLPAIDVECIDAINDVYVTPSGLPPWNPSVLGNVVRCAVGIDLTVAEVADRLGSAGVEGVTPTSGVATYYIAYRTTRSEGQEGVGTARLYLPTALHPDAPLPALVATHGTAGLADRCAPSTLELVMDYLALPFAGQGFAVVAPDYAGLGNEGTQGYGDGADTAHSVLDSARALRKAVTPGSLAAGLIAVGHSQGGGAALSAHAFGGLYGDSDVLGVIPFAPGWPISTNGLSLVAHFPWLVPYDQILAPRTTLALYADAANFIGPGNATDYFRPEVRADIALAVENDCIFELLFSLPPLGQTFADVLDSGFLTTVADCMDGQPSCGPPGEAYVARAEANIVPVDAGGGPILILQGLQDVRATPERTACIVEKIESDGITPQVCTLSDAGHFDIVNRTVAFAAEWAFALATGAALPACVASDLPPCTAAIFADGFETGDTSAWSSTTG